MAPLPLPERRVRVVPSVGPLPEEARVVPVLRQMQVHHRRRLPPPLPKRVEPSRDANAYWPPEPPSPVAVDVRPPLA